MIGVVAGCENQNGALQHKVVPLPSLAAGKQGPFHLCWMRLLARTIWAQAYSLHRELRDQKEITDNVDITAAGESAYLRCWQAIEDRDYAALLQASMALVKPYIGVKTRALAWPWGECNWLPSLEELLFNVLDAFSASDLSDYSTVHDPRLFRLTREQYWELDARRRLHNIEHTLARLLRIFAGRNYLFDASTAAEKARESFDQGQFRLCRVHARTFYHQYPFFG